jgi:hypothetical protein
MATARGGQSTSTTSAIALSDSLARVARHDKRDAPPARAGVRPTRVVFAMRDGDLLHRPHRLARHPGEGDDLLSEGQRLRCVSPML